MENTLEYVNKRLKMDGLPPLQCDINDWETVRAVVVYANCTSLEMFGKDIFPVDDENDWHPEYIDRYYQIMKNNLMDFLGRLDDYRLSLFIKAAKARS